MSNDNPLTDIKAIKGYLSSILHNYYFPKTRASDITFGQPTPTYIHPDDWFFTFSIENNSYYLFGADFIIANTPEETADDVSAAISNYLGRQATISPISMVKDQNIWHRYIFIPDHLPPSILHLAQPVSIDSTAKNNAPLPYYPIYSDKLVVFQLL